MFSFGVRATEIERDDASGEAAVSVSASRRA
jgi:hypothetical protein